MLTMAKNVIAAGADNRPHRLDKSQPFKYGTVEVPKTPTTPATIRDRTYDELTNIEKICEASDIKATNKAYHKIFTICATIDNSLVLLEPEWSKFVTDVKLAKDLHNTNFVHLRFKGDGLRGMQVVVQGVMLQAQRPRNLAWFKDKMLLVEALESKAVLDEEQMAFLADNGDTFNTSQESDLDAPSASAVLMAKLSAYDSDVLLEVPTHDTYLDNHVIDQSVQEMQYSEQPPFINDYDIHITSDSNVISYEQYLNETKNAVVQDTISSTQQDAMIMSMIEVMSSQVFKCLAKEITDTKEVFNQMETKVVKCFVERKCFDIEKKELFIENNSLLEQIICQDVMCIAMHANLDNKCVLPTNDDNIAYAEMEQSFIDEYSRKNRDVHLNYLKETRKNVDILHDIVEEARDLSPSNNNLGYACTARFENDHVVEIMGYGDYQVRNVMISQEEEDPQEEEDDMEIDIKEDENEPELTYPYEEVDPLNPSPPTSEYELSDEIEVENPIEHEDEC
nr:hypothetical protein [Tanacetum cinerariifolium]